MVLVVDKHKKPCNTISNAYARILLFNKQAVIHKRFPFTIRLKNDNAVLKDRAYTVKSGYFDIKAKNSSVMGIGHQYFHLIQRGDGYLYNYERRAI